jgi:hypothetical protein
MLCHRGCRRVTHVLPMLIVRGTRLKHANALFLSPMTNSMATRCASSLHWRLATQLILNFQHTDANTGLAPGDTMISIDPAAIRFLQLPKSSKAKLSDTDSKPQSSDRSQSSPSTKTASQGPSLTPFDLPQYASSFIFIPTYAEISFPTCSAIYVRHPTAHPGNSEIPTLYDADGKVIRLALEWYSKVRPRTRSKSQMARKPENRRIGGQ